MKKILCLFVIMCSVCLVQGQDLYSGSPANAYILKFKNKEKLDKGKYRGLKKLRKSHVQIKDGGKTVYINDRKYEKNSLHYFETMNKIYGLNSYNNHSWSNEQNYEFNYEIDNNGFYVIITEKQGDKFILGVYYLGERSHFFDLIKKNAISH
jgi:hypothetical protein